ncbi:PIG-L deacetylase family protein, partial [Spirosoma sp. 209]|uniref:PIG-L deacetylase family protein n=1 Tax=Spirosoma sp. 209 TaxID=1955701 RepID=UPI00098D1DF7
MISGMDKKHVLDERAHLIDPADLHQIGNALIIAPHPDDESLGCGGTIALLRQQGYEVHVLFVSDGTMSHPNSLSYPADRLSQVREAEALQAVDRLDVPASNALFMRLKDREVPTPAQPNFPDAVAQMRQLLIRSNPSAVFVPWRRDPHPDHRASWQILNAVLADLPYQPRVLEYLIWLWELGDERDMPGSEEMRVWQVPIGSVMAQRDEAIAAHRSQVTRMIDDDPTAFYLSPELLAHFNAPRELFL